MVTARERPPGEPETDTVDANAPVGAEGADTTSLIRRYASARGASVAPEVVDAVRQTSGRCWYWLNHLALMASDILSWIVALTLAIVIRKLAGGEYPYTLYLDAWPALVLVPLPVFILQGLYASVPYSAPDELGRLVRANTLAFAGLTMVAFMFHSAEAYSRLVFILGYGFSLVLTPLGRAGMRWLCARSSHWHRPCLVVGDGPLAERLVETLRAEQRMSLQPVACVGGGARASGPGGLPVVGTHDQAVALARETGIRFAVLANPELDRADYLELTEDLAGAVPHLIVIPSTFGMSSLWVHTHDLGGMLGLEVRNQLLRPWSAYQKRMMDVLLSLVVLVGFSWLFVLLMLAVRIGSRGPVFYSQRRVGRGGRSIRVWKFRSMVIDAEHRLAEHLAADPVARAEWERDHKLRNDPRVTWIGRFLRITSLDELPQIWNVLKGEMSLVGPRPVTKEEIEKYGRSFRFYYEMLPGVTGLWQVSGRNQTTYDERVAYDAYYARNWSFWLDLILLARTVRVVLLREGAY